MKDLKHYFSSPKDSEKSDESSILNESTKCAADNQSFGEEVGLKLKLSLKGKQKLTNKRKKGVDNCILNEEENVSIVIDSDCTSPENCKPAKKKRKCANVIKKVDYSNAISPFNLSKQSKDDNISNKNHNLKKEQVSDFKKQKSETFGTVYNETEENEHDSFCIKYQKTTNKILEGNGSSTESTHCVSTETIKHKATNNKKNRNKKVKGKATTDRLIQNGTSSVDVDTESSDVTYEQADCSLVNCEDVKLTDESSSKKRSKKNKKSKKKKKREDMCTPQNGKENQDLVLNVSTPLEPVDLNSDQHKLMLEGRNKILNYFNKVDKLPEIPQKVNILKVEAIIHSPPTGKPKVGSSKTKRKVKIRRNLSSDLDLITSEEDSILESSTPESKNDNGKLWRMRVQFSKLLESETDDSISSVLTAADIEPKEAREVETKELELKSETEVNDVEFVDVEIQPPPKSRLSKGNKLEVKTEMEDNVEFVDVEIQPPPKSRLSKGNGTLTSYFTIKASTKAQDTPMTKERLMAKKQFLESGVPENMKKMMKNKTSEVSVGSLAPFPKHSHVRQKDIMNIVWNLSRLTLPGINPLDGSSCDISSRKWSIHVNSSEKESHNAEVCKPFSVINTVKKALKQFKKEVPDLPISEWYGHLKMMKKNNEGEMWNEKFKPTVTDHFLENLKNIEKFKNWLENHRTYSKTGLDNSSGDEFAASDEETKKVQSMALLVGPSGSGKTSAVYAIANQIGYQVLELNASCNRAGKRLLLEFSEATQSHKLQVSSNFFGNMKTKKEENERTLLLLEDADLVFNDFDEGFLSAVNCLALSSKRPVVLIANDENCKHLNKIIPNCQLHLKFNLLEFKKLGCWLRTVGLAEGLAIDEKCATQLAKASGGDVRQSLLQLQFCSSPNVQLQQLLCRSNFKLESIWKNSSACDLKKRVKLKRTRRLLKTLTCVDIISRSMLLHEKSLQAGMRYWDQDLKDSTCVEETCYPPPDAISAMIVDELTNVACSMCPTTSFNLSNIDDIKKALTTGGIERGVGCWSLLSRTSVAMDYLSAFRRMAVSEQSRLASQTKRNNRYFNYLNTIGLNTNNTLLNILTTTFHTIQEISINST